MNPHTRHMIYITCYFLIIGTDIKFNHTNSAIHSSEHSHSLFTSASDYASAQWRLVLHILVTCSSHVNKCWVTLVIYGIRCNKSLTHNHSNTCGHSEDPLCHDGRVWQEVKGLCECPEALEIFQMDLKNICKF